MFQWFRTIVLGESDERLFETSRVVRVTGVEHWEELLEDAKLSNQPVVVDFAADWCGACRYIAPLFHKLSVQHPSTLFLKVDVDDLRVVATACAVTALPTFQFYKGGSRIDAVSGALKRKLALLVKKYDSHDELPDPEPETSTTAEIGVKPVAEVVEIKSATEWAELKQRAKDSAKTLVVDFWAPWCSPCVMIAPFFMALSIKHRGSVLFAKVDVTKLEDVRVEENVNAMPTFKVFKNGECVELMEDANRLTLESMVARRA